MKIVGKQKRKWLGQRPECVMGEKTTLSRWKEKCGGSSTNSRSGLAGDGGVNNPGWSVVGEKETEGKCWETWAGGSDTWLVTCGQCVRVLCEGITQRTLATAGLRRRTRGEEGGHSCRVSTQLLHFFIQLQLPSTSKCFLEALVVPLLLCPPAGQDQFVAAWSGQDSSQRSFSGCNLVLEELYIPLPACLSLSLQTVCVGTFKLKGDYSVCSGIEWSRLACCSYCSPTR